MNSAADRIRSFLDAHKTMGGPFSKINVAQIGVDGATYDLTVADLRELLATLDTLQCQRHDTPLRPSEPMNAGTALARDDEPEVCGECGEFIYHGVCLCDDDQPAEQRVHGLAQALADSVDAAQKAHDRGLTAERQDDHPMNTTPDPRTLDAQRAERDELRAERDRLLDQVLSRRRQRDQVTALRALVRRLHDGWTITATGHEDLTWWDTQPRDRLTTAEADAFRAALAVDEDNGPGEDTVPPIDCGAEHPDSLSFPCVRPPGHDMDAGHQGHHRAHHGLVWWGGVTAAPVEATYTPAEPVWGSDVLSLDVPLGGLPGATGSQT